MKRCPKCGKTFPDEANFCPTDAGRLVTVATDAIPAAAITSNLVAGRFELGPVIGGHSTGPVHRAKDTQGGGAVAVKLVAPEVLAIPQVAQRIDRELKQLERVQHKGVARVLASGKHADRHFVVTELIEGARPLAELIAASGPLDAQRASDLILAIGEALIEAAKVGVVHRDLAPKNVLVTSDSLRLINFAVPTPGGKTAGVPEFAAPESIEGKPIDQRSNIYSLGSIYYFLLTGRAPHIGEPEQVIAAHLAGQVTPPSAHAQVPPDVDALVVRSLERNAAKRFLTLRQFLDDVDRVAHGEPSPGATAPFGRAGGAPANRRELSQTLMGFGAGGSQKMKDAIAAKTKAVEMQVPAEAKREEPAPAPAPVPAPVAAPAPDPFAPAAAAMQQAAPAMGAAAMQAAPVEAAPAPAAAAPAAGKGGKKKADEKKDAKGKFRETMWFKKGELDAQAAEEAARSGDAAASDKADSLPMDERYRDDGSITRSDAEKYSLKTGATNMMPAMRQSGANQAVSERELVGEMKSGRNLILIVIIVVALALAGVIAAFAV